MFHLLKHILESGILVSGMSIVWEDTDGCAKKYRCALAIYLMTVSSYSYGIILDREINAPVYIKNVVDGLNETDKRYLNEKIEIIGKLSSNDISKIGMLPSASRDVSINFLNQCIHILNNKDSLNGLKVRKKYKKRITIKMSIKFSNFQRNSNVNQRGMKT